jgi:PhnB protein
MVSYEDAGAAADWLCSAFGFVEEGRYTQDGRVTHANLVLGDGVVMVGWPGPHYRSPRHHGEQCAEARRWLDSPYVVDGVHVRVDDVDAHYRRALEAGARMLSPLEDNEPVGQRQYRVEDLEGHRWMFAQPL